MTRWRGARVRAGFASAVPVGAMLVAVIACALLPTLIIPGFYFWDDTAAAAAGVWDRVSTRLFEGAPPWLQLDMWRGGNLAAEAATGIWNPVLLVLMAVTRPIDDLAVAMTVAKVALQLVMASGAYLLARSFGASAWPAAIVGSVLPFAGWTLYMDGAAWINGLAITAFLPWTWWSLRMVAASPTAGRFLAAVLSGYLLVSVGNPYGVLALLLVVLAVIVDAVVGRSWRRCLPVLAVALILAVASVVVYLPFLLTSSVGFRVPSAIYNDGLLTPSISDLVAMSTPIFHPFMTTFGAPYMAFSGLYLSWFVLPLLPWLSWRRGAGWWRSMAGLFVYLAVVLVLVLGPTQLGLFRWPARLLPFLFLGLAVFVMVVASAGLRRDRPVARIAASAGVIALGAWISWADAPSLWRWVGLATVVVAVGLALLLRRGRLGAWGFSVVAVTSFVLLLLQLSVAPTNPSVADYGAPTSRSALVERFGDRYRGVTVQVADFATPVGGGGDADRWNDLLPGNLFAVAGVDSTTAYSGVGFSALDSLLCMAYNGSTCADAWPALWRTAPDTDAPLADLLRAETVVLARGFVEHAVLPDGWSVAERTHVATVYTRDHRLEWPDGTLSHAEEGLDVRSDATSDGGMTEVLELSSPADGQDRVLTFARLGWPGYSATIDGRPAAVSSDGAGFVTVGIPPGLRDAELVIAYRTPGLDLGAAMLVLAALGAAVGAVVLHRRRRVP